MEGNVKYLSAHFCQLNKYQQTHKLSLWILSHSVSASNNLYTENLLEFTTERIMRSDSFPLMLGFLLCTVCDRQDRWTQSGDSRRRRVNSNLDLILHGRKTESSLKLETLKNTEG